MPPDLSVSIVNANNPGLLDQCLASLAAHTRGVTYETHLVALNYDAERLAALRQRRPDLILHEVRGVRGYSMNHNVALRAAAGRYVAILNDDVIFEMDTLGEMVRYLDAHPQVAAVCPALLNPDHTLQMGVRGRFTPWSFVLDQLKLTRLLPPAVSRAIGAFDIPWLPPGHEPVEVVAGTGAAFVARREAMEAIGFLDERYFWGPDDLDWTERLRRKAGPVLLLPRVTLVHLGGTSGGPRYHAVLPTVYAGCYTFFRRYYGPVAEWTLRLLLGAAWSAVLAAGWSVAWLATRSPRSWIMLRARLNCVRYAFSGLASPEVFARLIAA